MMVSGQGVDRDDKSNVSRRGGSSSRLVYNRGSFVRAFPAFLLDGLVMAPRLAT